MKDWEEDFLQSCIAGELDAVVDLRRELHGMPELGFKEHATSQRILRFLEDVPNLVVLSGIAGTGIVATLGADKAGPCLAFRADMDALPITEATGLPYASQWDGRMHACGHDGHSAILAGLARVLSRCGDALNGPVKFIFQPAEEGGAGGLRMVEAGVLDAPRVNAIFGLHGWPAMELGQVGAVAGPAFACTHSFDLRLVGRGGHAALPHQTIDPIPVAAQVISALQTLISRETDPLRAAVISICQMQAGNAYNVIPDQVLLKGTLRCFDVDYRDHLVERMRSMASGIAAAYGATAELTLTEQGYPALCNDAEATELFGDCVGESNGTAVRIPVAPTLGGEDFAFYAEKVPACFWLLGVKEPGASSWPLLHTPTYDFNDQAIAIGMQIQARIALRFQAKPIGAAVGGIRT